jgi:beta-lactamase class A
MKKYFIVTINLFILNLLISSQVYGQTSLQEKFEQIADTLKGNIGISALHLESGESISLNGDRQFPMQSVYKFPIAMVMLHEIDQGNFFLSDTISINKNEYIPEAGHSPIRDKYPNGAKLTIRDILEYNVSKSDGTACDVLVRLLGGTGQLEKSIHDLGVKNIAISTTEMVQVANDTIQYQNWSTPVAMNKLLEIFYVGGYLSKESRVLLLEFMSISNRWFDRRIKGLLPEETELAHKTGTARTYNGLTRATNDAGIITLPDGSHLAITVFISDSYDSQTKREMTIARAAKEAYDYWTTEKEKH